MRETRKQREARLENRKFWWLLLLAMFLLAGIGGGFWWARNQYEELDVALCPKRSGPRAIHLVLIDHTDPISEQQRQGVHLWLDRQIEEAKIAGERFELYTVEGDANRSQIPMLSVCSPGRGDDANRLYENPDIIRKRFEREFVAPTRKAVDALLNAPALPNSPILESIKASAISSFGRFDRGTLPLRITIISNMIQNSPVLSHYRSEPNFREFSRTPAWLTVQANLKGAQVFVVYLLHPREMRSGRPIQNRGHQQLFWEPAIGASNGQIMSFDQL